MVFYDSVWKDCTYTGRSTGAYVVFYQGGPIDNCTHVSGPVAKSSAESEYNSSYNAEMDLEYFNMLNNEVLNKDSDVFPEQAPLIILHIKLDACINNCGKGTKHIRLISKIMYFVRNDEVCNFHKTV